MAKCSPLLALALFVPGLAMATDPAMLELVMPDARAVVDINLERIAGSAIGQAMTDQIKSQLSSMHPGGIESLPGLTNVDWSRFAQEVLIASGAPAGPGQQAPAIVVVRGLLDPALIDSLHALNGVKSMYMGVPMVTSSNLLGAVAPNNAPGGTPAPNPPSRPRTVAFLDGSIALIGSPADVKAAIARRGQGTPPSPVLADGLARFEGQYDLWVVSEGPLAKTTTGQAAKFFDQMEAFSLGARFSPGFELEMDLTMRNEKDVAEMANTLRWFGGVIQTQEKSAVNVQDVNFKVDGKHLSLSLDVPEQQIRAALKQRSGPAAGATRPRRAAQAEVRNGLPEPPTGTIRVQSSPTDMGTGLVTLGKSQ